MELYRLIFDGGAPDDGMYGSYHICRGHKFSNIVREDLRFSTEPLNGGQPSPPASEFLAMIAGLQGLLAYLTQNAIDPTEVNLKIYTDSASVRTLVNGGGMPRDNLIPYHEKAMELLANFGKYRAHIVPRDEMVDRFGH